MEMRIASINLDSVDFEKLDGVRIAYPIPMPVLAKKSSDDVFLVYSLMDRHQWAKDASLDQKIDMSLKTIVPLEIPTPIFEKNFMPLGGDFDGTGIYGKIPNPVIALKVEVPCVYASAHKRNVVEPDSIVVKTSNGVLRHYDNPDYERMFVSDLSQLNDMKIEMKSPSNDLDLQHDSELKL